MTTASAQTGYAQIGAARLYYELAGEGQPFVKLHAGIAVGGNGTTEGFLGHLDARAR